MLVAIVQLAIVVLIAADQKLFPRFVEVLYAKVQLNTEVQVMENSSSSNHKRSSDRNRHNSVCFKVFQC